jgi:hypothetical protein
VCVCVCMCVYVCVCVAKPALSLSNSLPTPPSTHQFFQQEGFVYLQSPLITASDCEGAGEMFRVTTLPLDDLKKIKATPEGGADFSEVRER